MSDLIKYLNKCCEEQEWGVNCDDVIEFAERWEAKNGKDLVSRTLHADAVVIGAKAIEASLGLPGEFAGAELMNAAKAAITALGFEVGDE